MLINKSLALTRLNWLANLGYSRNLAAKSSYTRTFALNKIVNIYKPNIQITLSFIYTSY
jgi:hypothetical protein